MYINNELSLLIDKHGLNDIEPIVKSINNFEDFCIFGKAFIENKIYRHIDYLGPFGKSSDSNGHSSEVNRLIELHQYGILTTGGQINLIDKMCQQRSYLDFYCEKNVSNKILPLLLSSSESKNIYTIIFTIDGDIIHNVPKEKQILGEKNNKINVTKYLNYNDDNKEWIYKTNIWFDSHPLDCYYYRVDDEDNEEELMIEFDFILNKCLYISIIYKDYCEYDENKETSTILLNIIKEVGIPQMIK